MTKKDKTLMTDHDHEQEEVDDFDGLDIPVDTLAESDNYAIWRSQEPDGEAVYHIDVEIVTLHLYQEEWDEFVSLVQKVGGKAPAKPAQADGKKRKK
jgi:hypothetical protein